MYETLTRLEQTLRIVHGFHGCIVLADQKHDAEIEKERWLTVNKNGLAGGSVGVVGDAAGELVVKSKGIPWEVLVYVFGAFVLVLEWSVGAIYLILWYFDD